VCTEKLVGAQLQAIVPNLEHYKVIPFNGEVQTETKT